MPALQHSRRFAAALLAPVISVGVATAQDELTFSVDWHGPLQGTPDSAAAQPITAADVLRPASGAPLLGPLATPAIVFDGGLLGLVGYPACAGSAGPGDACVEVDALSYGLDTPFTQDPLTSPRVLFSVDEYASGAPFPGPSIASEAPVGDIATDVLSTLLTTPPPLPPIALANHVGLIDGDGFVSGVGSLYPGWGGTEPNVPGTGLPGQPDLGDNLDALDIGPVPDAATGAIYLSLDSAFLDPSAGVFHSGSAAAQGVSGADVLRRAPGGGLSVYAPAALLGLDQLGVDTDDLDALILTENGVPGYQPSLVPFDWLGGTSDMLAFSVRNGSAVVGQIDSLQGIPIVPGDLLIPPVFGGNGNPGVFMAAESMGMSSDRNSASSDEMNAADTGNDSGFLDCNQNGVEDAIDVGSGSSDDDNMNGVPDECESPGAPFCFCDPGQAPCSNPDAAAGCANSTGQGATIAGTGTSSLSTDDLVLTMSGLPPNVPALPFMGAGPAQATLGAGRLCVGGGLFRFPVFSSGPTGSGTLGPGIAAYSHANFGQSGHIDSGETWNFQTWYRDPTGPCATSNVTHAWSVTFRP